MNPMEKLGEFFLGREVDPATGETGTSPLMYDARDLTTHAVCVGMTGSGKTGLCVGLLEEAALDGIPAIIIDPKGDMANLLLTFPELRAQDFRPWVDPDEARRRNLTPDELATRTATMWKEGLASWGQTPDRITRLKQAASFQVYTPGSTAGTSVSILASLKAPRENWDEHQEILRDQIRGTVGALLGLAGMEGTGINNPEHILLSTIFETEWRAGRDLDLSSLILAIQNPPFRKLGVFDVDTVLPPEKRFTLAMALNGIMAAPGFSQWLEGEALDVGSLLHGPDGRPRHAIFSIAHLDDQQRMFFVTLLLEQVLSWVRRQSGTGSLRALLYMDEIFGFLPPTANPPSKTPLLTLLKQARAFGLGVVLATQNPVDLDYKALSNAGTWFIGKLQTERDKDRMLDGLQSVTGTMDRKTLDRLIGGLDKRVFLLHNVHEDGPVLFHTRWVMSYLRGPLTRDQIRSLRPAAPAMAPAGPVMDVHPGAAAQAMAATAPEPQTALPADCTTMRPSLPPKLPQVFVPLRRSASSVADHLGGTEPALVYRPSLLAMGQVGFVDRRRKVDSSRRIALVLDGDDIGALIPWSEGREISLEASDLMDEPRAGACFGPVPESLASAAALRTALKDFKDHLYRDQSLEIHHLPALKLYGKADESEAEFLGRARLVAREARDLEVDKLKAKVQKVLDRLEKKLVREERELDEDQAEYDARKREELLSAGETLVGILGIFGRRKRSGLATASRKRRMTARAKEDIAESKAEISSLQDEMADLQDQLEDDARDIADRWEAVLDEITTHAIKPRRTDVRPQVVALAWLPTWEAPGGEVIEGW